MLSKEEINLRFSEGNITLEEGIEILRSYIFLRKNQEITVIPPRTPLEMGLFQWFLEVIKKWSS